MAIPTRDWLEQAKRLAIGQTVRVRHLHEGRKNLIIGNDDSHWWCYCQSCKQGGREAKTHVRLVGRAPTDSAKTTLPHDVVLLADTPLSVQEAIATELAKKHMDMMYLPPLQYSESRKRLIVGWGGALLGRDLSGHSPQKWMTYNAPIRYLECGGLERVGNTRLCVVVEDPYSFFKVRFALRGYGVATFSSLGTRLSDDLVIRLLRADEVLVFYDGDAAGHKGAQVGQQRLRACGVPSHAECAPVGFDPKDMSIADIRSHVLAAFAHKGLIWTA